MAEDMAIWILRAKFMGEMNCYLGFAYASLLASDINLRKYVFISPNPSIARKGNTTILPQVNINLVEDSISTTEI